MEIVIPGAANLGLFTAAALALLLVPGPAVLYIVARSVEQGRVAGFVSDLGIHSATLVHVAAASLGLSALLMRSEEHTSELQSLMRISYAVFCLKNKKTT